MAIGDGSLDPIGISFKHDTSGDPPTGQLIVVNVLALALAETTKKHRASGSTVSDDRAIAAAFSLAGPRDALLDEASAEIGINEACVGAIDGLDKCRIGYTLSSLEAPEVLVT